MIIAKNDEDAARRGDVEQPDAALGGSTHCPSNEQTVGATQSPTEAQAVRHAPVCSQVYG